MATRTNFYKNPSYAYNKQFNLNSVLQNLRAYNIVTGNTTADEPATAVKPKHRQKRRSLPVEQKNEAKECDGSMSHQEYIKKLSWKCQKPGHLAEDCLVNESHFGSSSSGRSLKHVKCCKASCRVTDIKDILACHYCFNKAYDKFYDAYTATWKEPGLLMIQNSMCCEDHFEWLATVLPNHGYFCGFNFFNSLMVLAMGICDRHRMNCSSADVEGNAYIVKSKHARNEKYGQLNPQLKTSIIYERYFTVSVIMYIYLMSISFMHNRPPFIYQISSFLIKLLLFCFDGFIVLAPKSGGGVPVGFARLLRVSSQFAPTAVHRKCYSTTETDVTPYDNEGNRVDVDRRSGSSLSRGRRGESLSDMFDPFSPIRGLSQMLNMMVNPFDGAGAGKRGGVGWVDTREDEGSLQVRVDMPGLDKDEVKVLVEQNTLVIKGEGREDGRRYYRRVDLPWNAYKLDGVKAEMKNGVLKVVLPKQDSQDVIQVSVD
ncbi:hypothetical protein F511_32466 [Dorcoceras hygrometricum]|uniref:SHSP domain-containing protein n=1 Tax=Dorcoceras hygrometricum TaxID=472368 RepID=A0A2Z7CQK9_9LAMI|nr:hypothetical protein F511_32466 [Dorcoceras hygrometricum]